MKLQNFKYLRRNLNTFIHKFKFLFTLKQDFWSILGHIMYLALGLEERNVKNVSIKVIPVAIGTIIEDFADFIPKTIVY